MYQSFSPLNDIKLGDGFIDQWEEGMSWEYMDEGEKNSWPPSKSTVTAGWMCVCDSYSPSVMKEAIVSDSSLTSFNRVPLIVPFFSPLFTTNYIVLLD